jgi:hypothetical protein
MPARAEKIEPFAARDERNAMSKPKIFRAYDLERDDSGKVTKMHWAGDYEIQRAPTRAEKEAKKLAEWNELYGKKAAN